MNRKEAMKKLRFEEGLTLQEIGDLFEVSRERVRQIIGNSGSKARKKNLELLRKKYIKDRYEDLVTETDDIDYPGLSDEKQALKVLAENDIYGVLMEPGHPFDIKLNNGLRIDVKSGNCNVSKFESRTSSNPAFQLSNMKHGKDCDFFFASIPCGGDGRSCFVIPADEVKTDRIIIPWPPAKKGKRSKWHKYHNRFDLLEKEGKENGNAVN